MASRPSYIGSSTFLRVWPKLILVAAAALMLFGVNKWVQWTTLFVVVAFVHARWLPWQFTVSEDGLALTFAFGRRAFIPRADTTVRVGAVGAVALVGSHRRFGYPLTDHLMPEPNRVSGLGLALVDFGYHVVS